MSPSQSIWVQWKGRRRAWQTKRVSWNIVYDLMPNFRRDRSKPSQTRRVSPGISSCVLSGTSTSLRTAGAHKGDRAKQDPPRKDRKHTGKEKSKMNDTAMPLPPPPAPEQATRVTAKGREEAWHLCHDEHGNAYYYNETSGEQTSGTGM